MAFITRGHDGKRLNVRRHSMADFLGLPSIQNAPRRNRMNNYALSKRCIICGCYDNEAHRIAMNGTCPKCRGEGCGYLGDEFGDIE